jgi:hypothetical protein
MKNLSIKVALLSTFALTNPMFTFAGGQPKVRMSGKGENPAEITRAVQQGKGTGMSRNQSVVHANAWRFQKTAEQIPIADASVRASSGDSAFRK